MQAPNKSQNILNKYCQKQAIPEILLMKISGRSLYKQYIYYVVGKFKLSGFVNR